MESEADYIVVGAGSAGCVVASRLSENPSVRVLLIEAGGRDWSPLIHVPIGSGELVRKGAFGWSYRTEAEPGLSGRSLFWPRGKVLGGSSSINGQVYIRGNSRDFDVWAQMGNRGWSYEEVLPYFRRSEHHTDRGPPFHGTSGPMLVSRGGLSNPLFDAFVDAGEQAGFARNDDFNGAEQEGFGRYDFNIERGRRQSSAVAFLRPARRRPNLRIITDATVQSIELAGRKAVAVHLRGGGQAQRVTAAREIVLSAGTIGSPALLLQSGIGPAENLMENGVDVLHHLPGVGRNLQDHLQLYFLYGCSQAVTMHRLIRLDRAALAMAQALAFRSGPFAHFPVQCGAFTHTDPNAEIPDTQWHFGIALGPRRLRIPGFAIRSDPLDREGFAVAPCQLRPRSRGEITLTRDRGALALKLAPRYLSDPYDLDFFRSVFHIARDIINRPAFDSYRDGELSPGLNVRTDDEIDAWVRQTAGTCHHQVGTCRMGADSGAVVDEQLRVHGIEALRIADASIMPTLVGGNTHAATVMIGEKASDLIAARNT